MADTRALVGNIEALTAQAADVLRHLSVRGLTIATAESCTGGLLASLLTDIEGLSGCFERGFATYSNEAKTEMLGVDPMTIERHGTVSREVALAMVEGVLVHSRADVAVAITGFAGPAGPSDEEGLVHLAVRSRDGGAVNRECHFGPRDRDGIRHLAVRGVLEMIEELLTDFETAIGTLTLQGGWLDEETGDDRLTSGQTAPQAADTRPRRHDRRGPGAGKAEAGSRRRGRGRGRRRPVEPAQRRQQQYLRKDPWTAIPAKITSIP